MNNITMMSVDDIIPYANNPRNNKGAVDKVAASIREFGFKQAIVVDKDNGHHRTVTMRLGVSGRFQAPSCGVSYGGDQTSGRQGDYLEIRCQLLNTGARSKSSARTAGH